MDSTENKTNGANMSSTQIKFGSFYGDADDRSADILAKVNGEWVEVGTLNADHTGFGEFLALYVEGKDYNGITGYTADLYDTNESIEVETIVKRGSWTSSSASRLQTATEAKREMKQLIAAAVAA